MNWITKHMHLHSNLFLYKLAFESLSCLLHGIAWQEFVVGDSNVAKGMTCNFDVVGKDWKEMDVLTFIAFRRIKQNFASFISLHKRKKGVQGCWTILRVYQNIKTITTLSLIVTLCQIKSNWIARSISTITVLKQKQEVYLHELILPQYHFCINCINLTTT